MVEREKELTDYKRQTKVCFTDPTEFTNAAARAI